MLKEPLLRKRGFSSDETCTEKLLLDFSSFLLICQIFLVQEVFSSVICVSNLFILPFSESLTLIMRNFCNVSSSSFFVNYAFRTQFQMEHFCSPLISSVRILFFYCSMSRRFCSLDCSLMIASRLWILSLREDYTFASLISLNIFCILNFFIKISESLCSIY